MAWINDPKSKSRRSRKLGVGLAIAVALVIGTVAGPAQARWGDHERQGHGRSYDRGDHRGYRHGYDGGYYRAPPVAYGGYYGNGYYPPPVVYGPGIGIALPGIRIGIH